ncbi:Ig-like domain-containing protein, partial [Halomonas cupida]
DVAVSDDGATVTGSGEPGATVTVTDPDGTVVGEGTVGDGGQFEVTLDTPQVDGEALEVVQADPAGNASEPATATAPDNTAPAAPADVAVSDDGTTVTGSGEPGATVTVTDPDGTVIGEGTVGDGGQFEVTLDTPQVDGEALEVVQADPAGNASEPATATAPDNTAPTVSMDPLTTDDVTPALSGTVDDPDATVTVSVDGTDYDATNNGDGTWSLADDTLAALPVGDTTVTVTAADAAGNETAVDATITISDSGGGVTASLSFDDGGDELLSATEAANVTLSGELEPGSTITSLIISDGTTEVTVAPADISIDADTGAITVVGQDLSSLVDGEITVTAEGTDAAGGALSLTDTTTLDATAPTVALDPLTTGDATPALSGTVDDPDATITVSVDGTDYDATNNGDGTWSLPDDTLAALPEGDNTITVTATDAAGNETAVDATVSVDTTGPSDGDGLNSIAFDDGGDELLSADEVANVTLSGQLEAGSSITSLVISDGTNEITVAAADITVDGAGVVTVAGQDLSGLADGEITVTAEVTDAAGNTGTITDTTTLSVTAPDAPTIALANDTGVAADDGITSDGVVNVTDLVADGTWEYSTDGGATWEAGSGGSFELPEDSYADGNVQVRQSDSAGNISAVASLGAIVVDATGPGQPTLAIAEADDGLIDSGEMGDGIQTEVTLGANTEAGDTLTLMVEDGAGNTVNTIDYTVTEDDVADGASSVTIPVWLDNGSYSVTASASDAAGNVSAASGAVSFDVDATAPFVNVSSSGLLGLIGVDALGLVDLSNQVFSAYDPNNNLQSVTIEMSTVLSITQILSLLGVGEDSLNYSQDLANELGLNVEFEEMFMLLGIGNPATLTITAADGGTIDNLAINEFLATVSMGGGLLGTDVNVLPTFAITGTAADGQSGTDTATELADLSLLNPNSSFITEGTSGADTLEGTDDSDRLYGYEGNDTLIGGGGNDILRGGAGDDTLQISDDTFIMVDGGDGFDTLELDGGFDLDVTQVEGSLENLERIDLVDGDAGSTLTLDEDSVIELTDADNILQIAGDEADTLNASGAAATGNQQTIDGSVYAEYSLGSTTLLVDETVNVEVA